MTKKYLVTGGAGFIGSHIVHTLLAQGQSVRVLDNFSTGKINNLSAAKNVEIMEGDIRDERIVGEAVRGVDVIFNQAAFVSVPQSMSDPQLCFDINIRGTEVVLEGARKAGVRRVVTASSAAVYGDSDALPLVENSELRSLSPYAVSKQTNEVYAGMYTRSFGVEVVVLRYFNVFGPRQSPDSQYAAAVPIFIRRLLNNQPIVIYGDGEQTRDLIFVEDVVRANLLASQNENAAGEIFNICTGVETRLLDMVDVLQKLFPNAPEAQFQPARAGDIIRSVGDPAKAKNILDFTASVSLENGLKETVKWMRE